MAVKDCTCMYVMDSLICVLHRFSVCFHVFLIFMLLLFLISFLLLTVCCVIELVIWLAVSWKLLNIMNCILCNMQIFKGSRSYKKEEICYT